MCLTVMRKDVFYFVVYFHTILAARFRYDINATERFDGASQQFVRLQTHDKFILLINIACFVGGNGRYCFMV